MKRFIPLLAATAALAACSGGAPQSQAPAGPPPVFYVTVNEQPVTLTSDLPGRTSAYETSEVRPQVNGLIQARLFEEGDMVHAGQPLYRIDPSPYQASVASARAALGRADAAIASTSALARRYGDLAKINAISRQEAENAVTGANQARADVSAQQAAVRSAQIDLGRTTVRAPISGRIGRSAFTTGALATAQQADPLTTIQRLDPIYVDIQQSSADVLRLRQQIIAGQLARGGDAARIQLTLEDGTTYPIEGRLKFADVTVDPATGSQVIRAVVPNPRGLLLPGMFVRARLVEGTKQSAILVPQRAVSRDEKGNATVLVVGPDNKLAPRQLVTTRTVGDSWLVASGLKAGDRVVVAGAQMLRPGTPVSPQPFSEAAAEPTVGAPPAGPQTGKK